LIRRTRQWRVQRTDRATFRPGGPAVPTRRGKPKEIWIEEESTVETIEAILEKEAVRGKSEGWASAETKTPPVRKHEWLAENTSSVHRKEKRKKM
jgi:hypothetical protein